MPSEANPSLRRTPAGYRDRQTPAGRGCGRPQRVRDNTRDVAQLRDREETRGQPHEHEGVDACLQDGRPVSVSTRLCLTLPRKGQVHGRLGSHRRQALGTEVNVSSPAPPGRHPQQLSPPPTRGRPQPYSPGTTSKRPGAWETGQKV